MGEHLIGRRKELATIEGFLDSHDEGPAALLIEGEPGIGKTRLWREGVDVARAGHFRVLSARPAGSEVRLTWAGLGDMFGEAAEDTLPSLPYPQRHALEAALLLSETRDPPDPRAVAVAVVSVLRALAERGPVLIAVDDLQWLDVPSGQMLEFAFRRLGTEPIRLLASLRAGRTSGVPFALHRALPEGRFQRLKIGPLSLGALHELLRTRLGLSLPRSELIRVHAASRGNPFFALEIGRGLLRRDTGLAPDQPLPVPDDVRALLRDRLRRLPEGTTSLLVAAAALPRPTVALLEAATGTPGRASAGLEPALAAGVIELEAGEIRYTHPLLASVCYAEASPRQRRETHGRLAKVVESPEARARHLALATERPDEEVALTLDEAARQAIIRGAPQAAAELCEMAARLTAGDREADHRRRLKAAADFRFQADDLAGARLLLERLLGLTPKGRERADALLSLAKTRDDDVGAAIKLCQQALDEAGGDERHESLAHRFLSLEYKLAGDVRRGLRHARRALDLADRAGDIELVVPALSRVARIEIFVGEMTPGLLERALALENHAGPRGPFREMPRAALVSLLMGKGRLDEARELLQEELAKATAEGIEHLWVELMLDLIPLECRAGNWTRADELATELAELDQRRGLEIQGSIGLYCRALVDAYLGRAGESRVAAELGAAIAEASGDEEIRMLNVGVLGFLELSLGDFESATRHLRDLPARLTSQGWIEPTVYPVYPVWPDAIEALVAKGELELARDYLDQYQERAEAFESPWALAAAARCRGLLAAAEGDLPAAREALRRALTEHKRSPEPFERGRTLLALGSVERRAKQKRVAREALGGALAIFEDLGARLWAGRARDELERVGGRPSASGSLTPAERRVAELVAGGRRNREVAQALFVTENTVEFHLRGIYRKLGIRSRAELAHRFAELMQSERGQTVR